MGQPALSVRESASQDGLHILARQRIEDEDTTAREQRARHFKGRILGRRSDKRDCSIFDGGQKRVLLRFVEAMNLVYEEHRSLALLPRFTRFADGRASILDP